MDKQRKDDHADDHAVHKKPSLVVFPTMLALENHLKTVKRQKSLFTREEHKKLTTIGDLIEAGKQLPQYITFSTKPSKMMLPPAPVEGKRLPKPVVSEVSHVVCPSRGAIT